ITRRVGHLGGLRRLNRTRASLGFPFIEKLLKVTHGCVQVWHKRLRPQAMVMSCVAMRLSGKSPTENDLLILTKSRRPHYCGTCLIYIKSKIVGRAPIE